MHKDGLGFREIEILEKTETRRRLRAVPSLEVPETVARLLGDRFGYEERGTVDRARGEWRWSMAPNALGDKLRTEGTITIESAPGGKTRRRDDGWPHRGFGREAAPRVVGEGGGVHEALARRLRLGLRQFQSWGSQDVATGLW
jgi:hypothetical protein